MEANHVGCTFSPRPEQTDGSTTQTKVITPRLTKKGKNTLEAELIHDGGWLEQNCLGEKVTMTWAEGWY